MKKLIYNHFINIDLKKKIILTILFFTICMAMAGLPELLEECTETRNWWEGEEMHIRECTTFIGTETYDIEKEKVLKSYYNSSIKAVMWNNFTIIAFFLFFISLIRVIVHPFLQLSKQRSQQKKQLQQQQEQEKKFRLEKEIEKNFKETGFRETNVGKNIREEREIEEKRVNELVDETISKGGLENYQRAIEIYGEDPQHFGGFENTGKLILEVKAKIANEYEISLDYNKAIKAYKDAELPDEVIRVTRLMGDDKVKHLDYDKAIEIYESIRDKEAAKNARKLKAEQGAVKVTQKVVHGDEVTKTEIKDSVLNRSNVGAGGKSKSEELRDAKALFDDGIIDAAEFKQMKKEILGK